MGIVLNYCQYGVLYLGSHYNTGPYIHFPHFGNSNLGKLPYGFPGLVPWHETRGRNALAEHFAQALSRPALHTFGWVERFRA